MQNFNGAMGAGFAKTGGRQICKVGSAAARSWAAD